LKELPFKDGISISTLKSEKKDISFPSCAIKRRRRGQQEGEKRKRSGESVGQKHMKVKSLWQRSMQNIAMIRVLENARVVSDNS